MTLLKELQGKILILYKQRTVEEKEFLRQVENQTLQLEQVLFLCISIVVYVIAGATQAVSPSIKTSTWTTTCSLQIAET